MRLLPRNRFLPLPRPENDGTPGAGAGSGDGGAGAGGAGAGGAGGAGAGAGAGGGQQQQQAATRPDYLPETFWDPTKNAVKDTELKAHFDTHSKRQAELVTDPDKFEFKTELKDRAGNPISVNRDEPMVKAILAMAKERGWTGGDVNAMTEAVLTAESAAAEAEHNEFVAFGGGDEKKADARLTALMTRGATLLGKDDQGKPTADAVKAMQTIAAGLSTKAQFEALEKLVGGDPAAASGAGAGNVTNIAESWYGKDGLSGPGSQKKAS